MHVDRTVPSYLPPWPTTWPTTHAEAGRVIAAMNPATPAARARRAMFHAVYGLAVVWTLAAMPLIAAVTLNLIVAVRQRPPAVCRVRQPGLSTTGAWAEGRR